MSPARPGSAGGSGQSASGGSGQMRYRALPFAADAVPDGLWVAPLPSGPIGRLSGTGPLILDAVTEGGGPVTAGEVCERVRTELPDAPSDLEEHVSAFLEDLVRMRLLEHVG